jgi:hypothetical protein
MNFYHTPGIIGLTNFLFDVSHPRILFLAKNDQKIQCKSKHSFTKYTRHISVAMFNMFAKNYMSECNSIIHASRKRTSKDKNQLNEDDEEPEEKKRDKCAMKAKKLQSR